MKILVLTNEPYKVDYWSPRKKQMNYLEKQYDVEIERVIMPIHTKTTLKYIPFMMKIFFKTLFTKYDIIYAYYAFPTGTMAVFLNFKKKPVVVNCVGSDLRILAKKNKLLYSLTKITLDKADRLIVVSNNLKEIAKEFVKNPSKISIIYPGTDLNLFKPHDKKECRKKLGLPLNKKIILFVGNLIELKGILDLVKAFSMLEKDQYILCFVGEGDQHENLLKLSEELKISEYVIFAGLKPYREIIYWMNAADILVLPSKSEGFGNVIVEAIACGTPVIATNVGGIPEIITNNKNGLLIKIGDVRKLKLFMEKILSDKQLRKRLIKNGLIDIKKFSIKEQTKKRYLLLRDVIRNKHKRHS